MGVPMVLGVLSISIGEVLMVGLRDEGGHQSEKTNRNLFLLGP
jgi:hypothetical protein